MNPTRASVVPSSPRHRVLADLALPVAVISGFFTVCVGVLLLINHGRVPSQDPLKSSVLLAAKERLHADPRNEALKQEIRALDLQVRTQFFRHLDGNSWGAWMLLAGGVLFVVSAGKVFADREKRPFPEPAAALGIPVPFAGAAAARWAVAGTATILGFVLLLVALASRTPVPESPAALERLLAGPGGEIAPALPSREEFLRNWPHFRGPTSDGVCATTNLPSTWNGETGEGVLWKSPVPAPGFNSPVVWGDRVFLSGGTEAVREVFCFDAGSGALLWRRPVPTPPGGSVRKPEIPEGTGYAASTVATDGRRVYAIFATGELMAVDYSGRIVWSKELGVPENLYGHASSLITWQDTLVVQFDQGHTPEDGKSRLFAFASDTGRPVWEQKRPVGPSWVTPVVIEAAGRTQLITLAEPWVIAYDPAQGSELWRAQCLGADVAPLPVFAKGLLVVLSPNKHVVALRADGQGDVTETHRAWRYRDYVPDIASPVTNGELLFLLTTDGTLVCVDVEKGTGLWEQALEMEFNASPVLAGDRLYLISTEGKAVLVAAERAFRELGRAELGEGVWASPACLDGRLFIRAKDHLYCLGAPSDHAP